MNTEKGMPEAQAFQNRNEFPGNYATSLSSLHWGELVNRVYLLTHHLAVEGSEFVMTTLFSHW